MSDHPDFEALSAALDGEDELAAAHASGCAACGARLAELGAVRDAVGGAVRLPDAAVMDAAIARAVEVADEWGVVAEEEPVPAGVTPLPTPEWDRRGRRERRPLAPVPSPAFGGGRWRLWLTGSVAAAAVLLVVLAAVLVSGGSDGRDETATSAGSAADAGAKALQESAPPAGGAGGAAGAPVPIGPNAIAGTTGDTNAVPVQELGDVADLTTLRARATSSTAAAANATSRSNTGALGGSSAPTGAPAVVGTRVCEVEARTARPSLGTISYVANLRYQGTVAVALGFTPPSGGTPVSLLVLAPGEGCRLLAETTIP